MLAVLLGHVGMIVNKHRGARFDRYYGREISRALSSAEARDGARERSRALETEV